MTRKEAVEKIEHDIEDLYIRALQAKSFSVALKAKELLGRRLGMFLAPDRRPPLLLRDLTPEDIDSLSDDFEEREKNQNRNPVEEE